MQRSFGGVLADISPTKATVDSGFTSNFLFAVDKYAGKNCRLHLQIPMMTCRVLRDSLSRSGEHLVHTSVGAAPMPSANGFMLERWNASWRSSSPI